MSYYPILFFFCADGTHVPQHVLTQNCCRALCDSRSSKHANGKAGAFLMAPATGRKFTLLRKSTSGGEGQGDWYGTWDRWWWRRGEWTEPGRGQDQWHQWMPFSLFSGLIPWRRSPWSKLTCCDCWGLPQGDLQQHSPCQHHCISVSI